MGKSKDAFRTISEVAEWLDTQAHVLRFWESKFTQVKPVKRAGGRRYYRHNDMRLLGGIKKLLHDDGMTIKGAQKLLREKGVKHVAALSPPLEDEIDEVVKAPAPAPQVEAAPAEILEFARAEEPAQAESEDVSEMEGDLFQVQPTKDDTPAPETETAPLVEEEPLAEASEIVEDIAATSEPSVATDTTPKDSAPEAQTDQISMEPGQSLLPNLAATHEIAAENRAEARALIERLAALRARMAESETA